MNCCDTERAHARRYATETLRPAHSCGCSHRLHHANDDGGRPGNRQVRGRHYLPASGLLISYEVADVSKQHWKQLNNIRYSLYRMERPSLSPRFSAALLAAIATALVAGMVLLWGAYTACLIGAGVGIAVYQFAPLSKSWAETLDNQLTAYDPVDVQAYAELQNVTRSLGRLDLGEVFRWLDRERQALSYSRTAASQGPQCKFINRQVRQKRDGD